MNTQEGSTVSGQTILLLEDDPDISSVMKWTLEQAGYRVLLAHDGDAAFRQCLQANGAIDLFIADVIVPGISGLDVVGLVQSQWPEIKVVVCSGEFSLLRVGLALLRPGTPFLKKPFDPETLLARVRQALGEQEVSDDAVERRPSPSVQTVLLVDDDKTTLFALAKLLQQHGYRVVAAKSGEEALICWGEQPIDVLVTDVVMPEMSGTELARRLRVIRSDLPVLYISGLLAETGVLPAKPQRETFLPKPVTAQQLGAKLQGLLGRHQVS